MHSTNASLSFIFSDGEYVTMLAICHGFSMCVLGSNILYPVAEMLAILGLNSYKVRMVYSNSLVGCKHSEHIVNIIYKSMVGHHVQIVMSLQTEDKF